MKPKLILLATCVFLFGKAFAQNFTSDLTIEEGSPQIYFKDTSSGDSDYWIHANGGSLHFLWDEGDNGDWNSPYPLILAGRESRFGGDIVLRTNGTNPGDIIFTSNDSSQQARIWSSPTSLYLSSVDTTPDLTVDSLGNVGIGTTSPSHKLAVDGTIRAKELIVDTGWSDYVFEKDYNLASLSEVEAHIEENGHLPGIPSAAEIEAKGAKLSELVTLQMAKIEELTLHLIAQEKRIEELETQLSN